VAEAPQLRIGDVISVVRSGHATGARDADGEVVELVAEAVYRIRWNDGRETIYRPGRDVVVVLAAR
jgi:hypothetical protein